MDNATAAVGRASRRGLYVVSPAASVSRIVAWLAYAGGEARGASDIGGPSDTE